eukprot:comp49374_c0_seq1/m.47625 comp49374_c0_seq1/g.47625  ORF comp49374_c0_seq1/g.47625 comp49374_c0_seq1/m.47625 type:complete len:333 (-) comp49374_c0_seq1:32-1030(-)
MGPHVNTNQAPLEPGCSEIELEQKYANTQENNHLKTFRQLCVRFYFKNDPIAACVLNALETAKKGNEGEFLLELNVPQGVSKEEVDAELKGVGLDNGGGLDAATVSEYSAVKNSVRQDFHRHTEQQQASQLSALIHSSLERAQVANTGDPMSGGKAYDTKWRVEEVKGFVARQRGNVGAHPFMKGLRLILLSQKKQQHVSVWRLCDATLTQSGPAFMLDSVRLLTEVLYFTVDTTNRPNPDDNDWAVCSWMQDSELTALAQLLPKDSDLIGRASGQVVGTQHMRLAYETDSNSRPGSPMGVFRAWQRRAALCFGPSSYKVNGLDCCGNNANR